MMSNLDLAWASKGRSFDSRLFETTCDDSALAPVSVTEPGFTVVPFKNSSTVKLQRVSGQLDASSSSPFHA